jgi:hypothetical protein
MKGQLLMAGKWADRWAQTLHRNTSTFETGTPASQPASQHMPDRQPRVGSRARLPKFGCCPFIKQQPPLAVMTVCFRRAPAPPAQTPHPGRVLGQRDAAAALLCSALLLLLLPDVLTSCPKMRELLHVVAAHTRMLYEQRQKGNGMGRRPSLHGHALQPATNWCSTRPLIIPWKRPAVELV